MVADVDEPSPKMQVIAESYSDGMPLTPTNISCPPSAGTMEGDTDTVCTVGRTRNSEAVAAAAPDSSYPALDTIVTVYVPGRTVAGRVHVDNVLLTKENTPGKPTADPKPTPESMPIAMSSLTD